MMTDTVAQGWTSVACIADRAGQRGRHARVDGASGSPPPTRPRSDTTRSPGGALAPSGRRPARHARNARPGRAHRPGATRPRGAVIRSALVAATRRVSPGQATIEFALVSLAFFVVMFGCLQLAALGIAWGHANAVATLGASYAAAANGETSAVDRHIADAAARNGLRVDRVTLEVDTPRGLGTPHNPDDGMPSDGSGVADVGFDGTVTVRITYRVPLFFQLSGPEITVSGAHSDYSSGSYGDAVP